MSEVARENFQIFNEAYEATEHSKYVALADKCDRFYTGDQWDAATLAALGDRPALTINMAMKVINAVLGQHSVSRADMAFKPRRMATEAQAETLTKLVSSILDDNNYHQLENDVFADGVITDRGYLDVRMDFENNVLGEVKITQRDPRTVVLDSNAVKYDPATWTQAIISDWYSLDDIEVLYGKGKAEQIQARVSTGDIFGSKSIRFGGESGDETMSTEEQKRRVRAVRVIDRQYRKLARVKELVDLTTGDTRVVPSTWDDDRIKAVAQEYGLAVRSRIARRVRWTVTADNVELFDDWSPYDDFTLVPFFPFFRPGKPHGVMRHLISPQEQLNKSESQELHIINTTANSGWMVESGSLVNMTEQELEERGAETGLVLVHGKNRPPPQKIQPNNVPTGIDRVSQKAAAYVTEISGVAPLVGAPVKGEVSGVTINASREIAQVGLQPVFDNLNFTRRLVAQRILSLVQKFYTEPRVLRVTNWQSIEVSEEEMAINTDVVNNMTIGKYDVVVANVPARDTFDEMQFAHAIEMRNAGLMVPDHVIIEHSNLSRKHEIAEMVKQLTGMAEPSEEEAQMMQMQQEMAMQSAMLELQQTEAKIMHLQSGAMLNQAKAESTVADVQIGMAKVASDAELEQARMVADLQKTVANLRNKLELATLHIGSKKEITQFTRMSKFAESLLNNSAQNQGARNGNNQR